MIPAPPPTNEIYSRRARPLGATDFERVCNATAGITFTAYVSRARLARAMHLMATTRSPLCDIAQATGFADRANFSRLFVRSFGITPSRWRRFVDAVDGLMPSC